VEDAVHTGHGAPHAGRVRDVACPLVDAERCQRRRGPADERDDAVTLGAELARDRAADEARGAGDEVAQLLA
jgi:hypothetical protein